MSTGVQGTAREQACLPCLKAMFNEPGIVCCDDPNAKQRKTIDQCNEDCSHIAAEVAAVMKRSVAFQRARSETQMEKTGDELKASVAKLLKAHKGKQPSEAGPSGAARDDEPAWVDDVRGVGQTIIELLVKIDGGIQDLRISVESPRPGKGDDSHSVEDISMASEEDPGDIAVEEDNDEDEDE